MEAGRRRPGALQPLSDEVLESLCAVTPEPESDDRELEMLGECIGELHPHTRRAMELRYGAVGAARVCGTQTRTRRRHGHTNEERLEKLLDHYLDEGLAPDERAELEALLLSSPQARTRFWERARFHALLRRRGRENWGHRLAVEKLEDGVWMRWARAGTAVGNRCGTLVNHAPNAARESQGTIIGCSWTEGRWPGKKALDFKQIGDRVRLALPRKHEELTCVTWVRLDGMGRAYTALLMAGDATVGELQWQFRGDGKILFGKRKEPGWGVGKLFLSESAQVLGPERCGSWMQLAFVYDAHAGTLTHYLDGQPIGTRPMNAQTPLTTDAIEIGNWTPSGGDPVEPIRAFNGRMDEFLVFSRALRSEEIARLWAAGSPF